MHSSLFFKLFPPPKLMVMKHAGLHISDEAVRCLEYDTCKGITTISKYGQVDIPAGLIDGGVMKDEKKVSDLLRDFDHAQDLSYVKVSVPEEKSYLFQTDVPSRDVRVAAQNIEFKLEDNVPLSASDMVFYFDLLPVSASTGSLRASVSVVQRAYVEHLMSLLREVGIYPMAFEVMPKAIARAIIPPKSSGAQMIVYVMARKTGIYIVSGGVVCFTSTIGWGSQVTASTEKVDTTVLTQEINRIYTYWDSHSVVDSAIEGILLVGRESLRFEEALRRSVADISLGVNIANVWQNALKLEDYVPTISRDDSLDYVVAAGLAMSL
jgi:Tfp pilus assembly PilM family ATPase